MRIKPHYRYSWRFEIPILVTRWGRTKWVESSVKSGVPSENE